MIGHVEAWDIGIYANPDYYFQYDSQAFRDAYAKALKSTRMKQRRPNGSAGVRKLSPMMPSTAICFRCLVCPP